MPVSLRDADGFPLGTLAVADVVPREITEQQKHSLKNLASIALDRWNSRSQGRTPEAITAAETARQDAVTGHAELRQVIECLPQAIVLLDEQNRLISGTGTMRPCSPNGRPTSSQAPASNRSIATPSKRERLLQIG